MHLKSLTAVGRQSLYFQKVPIKPIDSDDKDFDGNVKAEKDLFLVDFSDTPECNPKEWSFWYKVAVIIGITSGQTRQALTKAHS